MKSIFLYNFAECNLDADCPFERPNCQNALCFEGKSLANFVSWLKLSNIILCYVI